MEDKALEEQESLFQSLLVSYRSWRWQLLGAIEELSKEKDVDDLLDLLKKHLSVLEANMQAFKGQLEKLRQLDERQRLKVRLELDSKKWRRELEAIEKEVEEDKRKGKIELAKMKTRLAETYRRMATDSEEQVAKLEKLHIEKS